MGKELIATIVSVNYLITMNPALVWSCWLIVSVGGWTALAKFSNNNRRKYVSLNADVSRAPLILIYSMKEILLTM